VSRVAISRSNQRWAIGFCREAGHTVSSRHKIGVHLAMPLQFFKFTPLDDLEMQVIPDTISCG